MVLASLLAALAAAIWVRTPPIERLRTAGIDVTATKRRRVRLSDVLSSPWFAAAGAAVTAVQFVSGWLGVIVAMVAAFAAYRWVSGLESLAEQRRRARLSRDLPVGVDLLVAALSAGRPPSQALSAVAASIGGPLGAEFTGISARLDLGADPVSVWREVSADPVLAPLGRAFGRASYSGAAVTTVLGNCVEDLRRRRGAEVNRAARSAGVRTAAPLGLCFLPAFILVGVVPTVIGAFSQLVL